MSENTQHTMMELQQKMQDFVKDRSILLQDMEQAVDIQENFSQMTGHCVFFRIESLTYEEDFPRLEAFENVVASIKHPECRLVYYVRGTRTGVEFYIGAVINPNKQNKLNPGDYEKMLENALKGNFLGTKLKACRKTDKENPAQDILNNAHIKCSTVLGIPSRNKEKDDISFQGVDRLVNIMDGINFHLMVIWEPVQRRQLDRFDYAVKEIYSEMQRIAKYSEQVGRNTSRQEGRSWQESKGRSDSKTEGTSVTDTKGTSSGKSSGDSYDSKNSGSNESQAKGTNKSITESTSSNESNGTSRSDTTGESHSTTHEIHNKHAGEIVKYIDDELLPRLRQGKAKGMYRTAMYLAADKSADLALLENAVTSIYQGDSSTFFPLHIRPLSHNDNVRHMVGNFRIYNNLDASTHLLPLYSRPVQDYKVSLGTWLTPAEISIVAGLPQKEVPGLELREQVGFGLNIPSVDADKATVYLGHMLQEGNELKKRPVSLLREDLDKHIFVAGTTGSGKTTTCLRLLAEANMPFMVIEPAKTEYRILLNSTAFQDTVLFTLGNENGVPFRFNPFEFLPNESLSAHVDVLKACFMASFDMEAAIPNLLEEALYKTYEAFGWSIADNDNEYLDDRSQAWSCGGIFFPTISDYLRVIKTVVDTKGFDQRLKDDYLGSIRARLDSLRTGVKGLMLDTRLSVDFESLLDKKVILELEELKSGEDKSFVMGLVLGRLVEALKARHKKDPSFKHITLVEEAHRLLSRPHANSSPGRMLGVEMFTDMLAEVRKYGESLIIVDQIPNKLAPEVLKNTNTKIIHKLFARDDKDAIGNAIALDDKQKDYLSQLGAGEAIMSSQGWRKSVNVQVEEVRGVSTSGHVAEEKVLATGWAYWLQHPWIFSPCISQELAAVLSKRDLLTMEILKKLHKMQRRLHKIWQEENLARWELWEEFQKDVQKLLQDDAGLFLERLILMRHMSVRFQKKKPTFYLSKIQKELQSCFAISDDGEFLVFYDLYLNNGGE